MLDLDLDLNLELAGTGAGAGWQLFPWTQALCTVILVGGGRKASPRVRRASIWGCLAACLLSLLGSGCLGHRDVNQ
jgi:hypothetical protein